MSRTIKTSLTKLLGIRTPVVCPPMAGVSGGALAARVTAGGGFGFISAGYDSVEKLKGHLQQARSILNRNENDSEPLPIGVGFFAWNLEKGDLKTARLFIETALQSNVQALWFAFGNELKKWIQLVRELSTSSRNKPVVFVQVTSVEDALLAVEDWGADVVVAQGMESGGHGSRLAPPLFTLVSSVLARLPPSSRTPIVAAGGIANGAQVASLLTLGVSGVVLGTRFLLSPESMYSDVQREALIKADYSSTVRTMAFDQARGTLEWPPNIDGRGLRNDTVRDYEAGIDNELLQTKFREGIKNGDHSRILVWAGTGVGLMNVIKPASDLVQDLHRECEDALKAAARL